MISAQAKQSLDQMLMRGICSALPTTQGQHTSVEVISDTDDSPSAQTVALTVCSLRFRAMVLIHFNADAETRAYFANINRTTPEELDERAFQDAVGECANICVGSMNRDLATQFIHVGMSTPNILDKNCASFLARLGGSHVQHFAIAVPDGPRLQATLCINAFEEIDFCMQPPSADAEASGELEMF